MRNAHQEKQRRCCSSAWRRLTLPRVVFLLLAALLLLPGVRVFRRYLTKRRYRQSLPPPEPSIVAAAAHGWNATIAELRRPSARKHVMVEVRFGLANRLRALASAMAVAAA